jgi:glycosyltransferase involved in cell wall biosynthesis
MALSVLMSVYAKETPENLAECLQSLCEQTLTADEVVLVEDGPISDELKAVIEQFRDTLNIVSVPLAENVGLACALNEGLKYCKHDLVARMDSDDIALPDRFQKQVAFMQHNPDIAASSGVIEEFNEAGQVISKRVLPLVHSEIVAFAKKRSPLSHPAVIFRKSVVLDVGGYPLFRNAQDYALWSLLIVKGYKLANLSDTLVRMRTGSEMMGRRGLSFLKRELQLLSYQRNIGLLSFREFAFNAIGRTVLRLSPAFIKTWLYKVAR